MASGDSQRAESCLREAATASGTPPPGLSRALTSTTTAAGRTRGAASWSTLPAGLVINRRYRLEAEVGRGGMASVYRACGIDRLNRGQTVAVKVPAPDLMRNEQTCDRFVQEIQVSHRLSGGNHPHIVQTIGYEVFEDPRDHSELYGLVMEFVNGRSLADYLAERRLRDRPLSLAEVRHFMEPVSTALSHAHEQTPATLHRDVKPHNVMITSRGEVKLMDFGIARVLDESAGGHLTSAPIGTPVYMPPEFLNPAAGVDARSDVYLAGNLLLELLTLHPMGDPESRQDCPPAWVDLINDSMSRIRGKRPATMREFLTRFRAGLPAAASVLPSAVPSGGAGQSFTQRVYDRLVRAAVSVLPGSVQAPGAVQTPGNVPAPTSPPATASPVEAPSSEKTADAPPAEIYEAIPLPEVEAGSQPTAQPAGRSGDLPHMQPLADLPVETAKVAPARLHVLPEKVDLGELHLGQDVTFTLRLDNDGEGEISGSIESESPWLVVPDTPHFYFAKHVEIDIRLVGRELTASAEPYLGTLVIKSNGGEAQVPVRAVVPPTPFAEGVLAGAATPRQLAEVARSFPRDAAMLIESGKVERWYESNGWTYPVQGPRATGMGALQQYFESVGIARSPSLSVSEEEVRLVGRPGASVSHTLSLTTPEKRYVYAFAESNRPWLVIESIQYTGNEATINLSVPQVPGDPGDVWLGEVSITGNARQRFKVTVQLDVCEPTPPPVPITCINPHCGISTASNLRHCIRCHTPLLGMPGMMARDRYRLLELVSVADGIATYRAEDIKQGNRLVLLEDLIDTRPRHFDIRQEQISKHVARLTQLQTARQVPRLYEAIEETRAMLVVREEIRGKPLPEVLALQPSGHFRLPIVRTWAMELCDMLTVMHGLNPPLLCAIIRPEDLLLDVDNRTLRMPNPMQQIIPAPGTNTARYTAPEVWAAKSEARSAIFSLATTLYELATGEKPDAANTVEMLRGRQKESLIADEERTFYEALMKALAADPAERFPSAAAMKAAIKGK
ncbi:MAG: protein kinase [Thermomicrobiales bacterium]